MNADEDIEETREDLQKFLDALMRMSGIVGIPNALAVVGASPGGATLPGNILLMTTEFEPHEWIIDCPEGLLQAYLVIKMKYATECKGVLHNGNERRLSKKGLHPIMRDYMMARGHKYGPLSRMDPAVFHMSMTLSTMQSEDTELPRLSFSWAMQSSLSSTCRELSFTISMKHVNRIWLDDAISECHHGWTLCFRDQV